MKPVLVSGIQPTGKLHLGNYLGALKNFVDLQNSGKYRCYFFIADMHALTENPNPKDLQKNILNLAADYLATGLDPEKSVIFIQSQIPAHAELTSILNNLTPFGEAERMTQFKEKSKTQPDNINLGLFYYPVLMTADVILYDANVVPVGEDQRQHLELARTLVRKFNSRFGEEFTEPKEILTNSPKIMDLRTPGKKMSKSDPNGCLFLDDSPEEIRAKIARAETDSHSSVEYAPHNRPGISNLILIFSEISGESLENIQKKYQNKRYDEFKKDLAELIVRALRPFQERKKKLKPSEIKKALASGNKKANAVASKKLAEVKKKIGLII